MTRFAIIISVEEYNKYNPTRFTHADNDLLLNTLTKKCDYADQHTISLKLSPKNTMTPNEILEEIKTIVATSNTGDSILFYFAGHGHYDNESSKTYLILPDTVTGDFERTALKFEDISNILREADKSCFRIFDTCHSGADVRNNKDELNSLDFIRAINNDKSAIGWVTLAACKEDESSIGDPKIGHGVFTYYLCKAIEEIEIDEDVLPEILKITTVDNVVTHSKAIGHIQTPTLIASISGNISLATRKKIIVNPVNEAEVVNEPIDLERRIKDLSDLKEIGTNEFLTTVLEESSNQCLIDFKKLDNFGYEIAIVDTIKLFEAPEEIEKSLINFSEGQGFNPRHELKKKVTYERPLTAHLSIIESHVLSNKKKITYIVDQPTHMPESITIIRMYGDKRCLPEVNVYVYVIPLQITACVLISVFNYGWNNNSEEAKHIHNYYQIIQPDDNIDKIKSIGTFAAKEASIEIEKIIQNRVSMLERELKME